MTEQDVEHNWEEALNSLSESMAVTESHGWEVELVRRRVKAAIAAMPRTFEATCLCGHTLMMTEGTNKHEKALAVARGILVDLGADDLESPPDFIELRDGVLKALATIDEIVGK